MGIRYPTAQKADAYHSDACLTLHNLWYPLVHAPPLDTVTSQAFMQVSRVHGVLLQVHTQKGGKVYLPIGVDRVEPWLLDGLNVPPLLSTIFTGQPLDLLSYYSGPQVRGLRAGCAAASVHCPASASAGGWKQQHFLQASLALDCPAGCGVQYKGPYGAGLLAAPSCSCRGTFLQRQLAASSCHSGSTHALNT